MRALVMVKKPVNLAYFRVWLEGEERFRVDNVY